MQKFTDAHWQLYNKVINERDASWIKIINESLIGALGLRVKAGGQVYPLAHILKPDTMKGLLEREDQLVSAEHELTEEESFEMAKSIEKMIEDRG